MQINRISNTPIQRRQAPQQNFKSHFIVTGNPHVLERLDETFQALQKDMLNYGLPIKTSRHTTTLGGKI